MICAYNEIYLKNARDVLAVMFDYAVNVLAIDGNEFSQMFAGSESARQFSYGNPSYVAGLSGVELAHRVLEDIGLNVPFRSYQCYNRTPEYWAGWAIAYYQWKNNLRFSQLLSVASFEEIVRMYRKYHEMDILHFCDELDLRRKAKAEETNLKRLRRLAGYTQNLLALQSGVPLRTIQQYEQRQKNINNAQAETVLNLARVLGCASRDLLEA